MTKARGKKGSSTGAKTSSASRPAAPQVTAAQLYQQAQIALRFDDFDAAKSALKRACQLEPQNGPLIDAYACLLAELSDESAQEALLQAISIAPTSGHEKYMYLAQLEEDPAAALQYSSKGLELLQSKLQAASSDPQQQKEAAALSKALCGALCSHAEMLLSQACNVREEQAAASTAAAGQDTPPDPRSLPLDASAVQQIESCLSRASELQPNSPEPGQALACLRSEQGRAAEALAALRQSMSHWWDFDAQSDEEHEQGQQPQGQTGPSAMDEDMPQEGIQQQHDGEQQEDEEEEQEEDDTPSFEFRFECAKLLLELDETTETAVGVLASLVEEHDSNPDVVHTLALALYSGGRYDEAMEVAVSGQTLLRKLRVPKKDDSWASFEELLTAIKEAMGHAAAAAGAAGIKGNC